MAELEIAVHDSVATLTLNRPEHRNTITQALLDALAAALLECDADPAVRVVILTGAGAAFCAGLDLNDAASVEGVARGGFGLRETLDLKTFPPNVLHHMDTPTLCAINGGAAGIGLDLALGCDIRLAADNARLAAAFTRRGVLPESGGTWHLPRLLGWAKAAELVFTGRTLSAQESAALGLVSRVCPAATLSDEAAVLASEIAASAPLAVQASKRMMRAGLQEGFDAHVERVYLQLLPLFESDDFAEGVAAFLAKRPPHFKGL